MAVQQNASMHQQSKTKDPGKDLKLGKKNCKGKYHSWARLVPLSLAENKS